MVNEKCVCEYGDGVAWFRGSMLGKGAFGSVYLATLKNPKSKYSYYPRLMAVKSAEISASGSIQKEREVLSNIDGCPDIIRCFGDETTMGENGAMVYNLLLEFGSGGTLADKMKQSIGNGLPEIEVRLYVRSILRGLKHIHRLQYVHCDLKPENILLVSGKGVNSKFRAKIGDFGLAKREKQSKKRKLEPYWRGTPMYLSPEAVIDSLQEAPSDIWALGCIVLEMLTGKPPWERANELSASEILKKIGPGRELPNVPSTLSKEARDFLKCCFVRNSNFRFTAEMLLIHPFVEGLGNDDEAVDEEVERVGGLNDDSLFSDELCVGSEEEGSISSWSAEEVEFVSKKRKLKVEETESNEVSPEVVSRSKVQVPVSFTVPAGA